MRKNLNIICEDKWSSSNATVEIEFGKACLTIHSITISFSICKNLLGNEEFSGKKKIFSFQKLYSKS